MKKLAFLTAALLVASITGAYAGHVDGYYRADGTYVQPYERSAPNGTATDNYSYQGNVNPYTGSTGNNNYQHDLTSPHFNGTPYGDGHYGHQNYGN